MEKAEYAAQLYQRLRRILVRARKRKGWTQKGLARQLGRSQSFVAKYERGFRHLDVVDFLLIAQALAADPKRIIRRLEKDVPAPQ